MERMAKENSGFRWIMLLIMLASFTVTFMTRFIWAPLIPTMSESFGISKMQAGAYMSAFYTGYIITQIPGGVLADRFGVKFVMSISLLIGGLATFSLSFMTSYEMGFALRIATGLGAGCIMACCGKVIARYFKPEERSIAFGILLVGPTAGLLLSNFFGPILLKNTGWQGAFTAVGIAAMVVAVMVFLLVKTEKIDKTSLEKVDLFGGLKLVFRSKGILLVALAGFSLMWLALGTATWANAYMGSLGIEPSVAGQVMMLYSFGGIIASISSGFLVDKLKLDRRKYVMCCYALLIVITLIFGMQTQINVLMITGFIFGFISYTANPHLNSLIIDYSGIKYAATATGASNCLFQFASLIGPTVFGFMADATGSFTSVWVAMAAGPLVGIFLLMAAKNAPKVVE
ncbi:MAG: MFS transporter [Eubacteriaceae bacterium]